MTTAMLLAMLPSLASPSRTLARHAAAGALCGAGTAGFEAARVILQRGTPGVAAVSVVSAAVTVLLPAGLVLGALTGALRLAWGPAGPLRPPRVSSCVGASVALVVVAWAGVRLLGPVLAGAGDPSRAGVVLAFATALGLAPALLIARPVSGAARRALGAADVQGFGRLVAGALAGVGLLLLALVSTEFGRETLDAIDGRVPGGLAAAAVLLALCHRLVSVAPGATRLALAAALALAGHGLTSLDTDAQARGAALGAGGLLGHGLSLVQRPFDGDGDGHARVLGGMDCDDGDARVHPGATDVPENGVDEDCSGRDLEAPPPPSRSPARLARVSPPIRDRTSDTPGPIILVSVDTLRPDHLGVYGYDRPTSPHIDGLAKEAAVFLHAYAPSNKTPDSMPAVLTGRYAGDLDRSPHHFHKHHEDNVFVTERLAAAGWRTGGVAAHWYFRPEYGLHQGFDHWEVVSRPGEAMERMATSEPVTDKALAMLDVLDAGPDDRFMLFVHYLDPHKWYRDHEGFEPFGPRAKDRYDGEIRYTDHHLGRLLKELRKRRWWERATVALISDHGEAFGEHGERFHGWSLYEHEVRAPFLLKAPGVRPGAVATAVSLMDLTPTLLDVAGLPAVESLRGVSILPALRGSREWAPRPIYLEMPPGPYNPVVRSLIVDGRLKVIHRRRGDVWELYDLAVDPAEERDLARTHPKLLDGLKDRLQRRLAAGRATTEGRG